MFNDAFEAVCKAGVGKNNLLKKNPLGYVLAAILAGAFIGFGSLIAFTVGQAVTDGGAGAWTKLAQGVTFASALSLVVMAGAELFTGNNLVMGAAAIRKSVTWGDAVKLWVVCWLGNLVGSWMCAGCFQLAGIPQGGEGAIGAYFNKIAQAKVGIAPMPLIFRAILCNTLVCLAVWCGIKLKSESGKLLMIFWCIIIFMVCGFEHSVANMTTIAVGVLNGGVNLGQYFYNVCLATIGNMIGGVICVALPYHIIAKEK